MILRYLKKRIKKYFFRSSVYWEQRYLNKGSSGVGSYGKFAEFKAEIINNFLSTKEIHSAVEFGCGDGNQLSLLNYPNYIGIDVSKKAVEICRERFKNDSTKKFIFSKNNLDLTSKMDIICDLSLSLDVIFHLIEDKVFEEYMTRLFSASEKYVIIYSSNEDDMEKSSEHVKHRKFTNWIEENKKEWALISFIKNEYPYNGYYEETSFSDFFIYEKVG